MVYVSTKAAGFVIFVDACLSEHILTGAWGWVWEINYFIADWALALPDIAKQANYYQDTYLTGLCFGFAVVGTLLANPHAKDSEKTEVDKKDEFGRFCLQINYGTRLSNFFLISVNTELRGE